MNTMHPVMMNPWQKVAHALTYVSGLNIYKWKRSTENWILSIPVPSAPNKTVYEDFEEEFIESWTDTNESHRAAAALDKLWMKNKNIDEYITIFAELVRKCSTTKMTPLCWRSSSRAYRLNSLNPICTMMTLDPGKLGRDPHEHAKLSLLP